MGDLLVRQARLEDVPAILQLIAADAIREVTEIVPADVSEIAPEYLAAFEEIDADPNTLLLVGELNGEVVTTCQLSFLRYLIHHGGLVAQMESVRTVSHLRGKGIGRTLMDWAIAEARRRGAVRVQLTSNNRRVDAHRFYEKLGFVGSHLGMKLYLGGQA